MKFYMYRIKVERDKRPLFQGRYKLSRDIIEAAIGERPRIKLGKQDWLIGNVDRFSTNKLFFEFGKITKSISEKYDEDTKSFADVTIEQAPYTYVAVDLGSQVCAIAVKVKISPTVSVLANRLVRVLNTSKTALESNVEFVLPKIKSTNDLLKTIQKAERIKKFEVTFSPPNPWDVEKDFHKPQEEYLKQIGGKKGKTIISGESLDKTVIKNTVKSIASTGNEASVTAKMSSRKNLKTARLGGDPVTFSVAESDSFNEGLKKLIFTSISDHYNTIRGKKLPSRVKSILTKRN